MSMLSIDLRQLKALRTIATEGSFQRAARTLDYTQSAVSQQISSLERTVGRRLVNRPRGGRPLTLTEAGKVILRHAATIEEALSVADLELSALDHGAAGALRVGICRGVGARLLPDIANRFRLRCRPMVEVLVTQELGDAPILSLLERDQLDLAFVEPPLPGAAFAHRQLLVDEYALVVTARSPLVRRQSPATPETIAELPLIGFKEGTGAARVDAFFRARGLQPRFVLRVNDDSVIQSAVAAGYGAAFVPRLAVDPNREDVCVVPLAEKLPPRSLVIAWRTDRPLSAAAQAFVDASVDACAPFAPGIAVPEDGLPRSEARAS